MRPKKVKYPIPEIPDDSGKKSGTDWVLPKIIGSGRVSGTRQALLRSQIYNPLPPRRPRRRVHPLPFFTANQNTELYSR